MKTFCWWLFYLAGILLAGNGISRLQVFDQKAGNGLFIGVVVLATFMHLQGYAMGQTTERRRHQAAK